MWTVLALRLPNVLELEAEPLLSFISRFFSDSFFSRCSRWIGVAEGTGVRDAAREVAGFNGDGTLGACSWSRVLLCGGVGACDEVCESAMFATLELRLLRS